MKWIMTWTPLSGSAATTMGAQTPSFHIGSDIVDA